VITVAVQIGNSDDKLLQVDWALYCEDVSECIDILAEQIHFSGASHPFCRWQNACWVFEIEPVSISELKEKLTLIRKKYIQDSIAILVGNTDFI